MIVIDMDMPNRCDECGIRNSCERYLNGKDSIKCLIKTNFTSEELMCLLFEIVLSPADKDKIFKMAKEMRDADSN